MEMRSINRSSWRATLPLFGLPKSIVNTHAEATVCVSVLPVCVCLSWGATESNLWQLKCQYDIYVSIFSGLLQSVQL